MSIRVNGKPWREVTLTKEWQTITIRKPAPSSLFRTRSWSVEAIVGDPWIPNQVEAGSQDRRYLGIQLGATVWEEGKK
ncbi:MAG: hypothetical protein NTV05_06920 [Acidobacteria bacterium]|nr:hypothetical protein [Acidobacteriota bacterium]